MSAEPSMTAAHRVGSIVSSARQILRRDPGPAGELDRLTVLSWLLFLKFVDDLEQRRSEEAGEDDVAPPAAIEPPYRWCDWAAGDSAPSGRELIGFINGDRATLPDGSEGPGLFAYLRNLPAGPGPGIASGDRRAAIAAVFRGIEPPALDGKRLRDVIAQIDAIDLASPAERHTLSQLFETMLREIRDVSGDSGDFYTPRPLVRFMVEMSDPQPGEIILDPACGTGGFLVEAMDRLQERGDTAGKPESLHNGLLGYELRSLPLLLAQLNLLMHGFEEPHIDAGNGLHVPGIDVDNSRRADVILTHPPFGGAADKAVLDNFPEDMRTADTTLLFLQLVMSALKPGEPGARPARAAMIVPNGTLFADGAGARIKADLLERYALHTIVRLPEGVFAPYTDIPTNLLFFDTSGPTRDVWFYQIPLPEGRRKYTKTRPMEYAEFDACRAWWNRREENANAWKLRGADLVETDESGQPISVNLDIKNPNSQESVKHRPPEELIADMVEKERWVMEIMEEIKVLVGPHR